MALVLSANGYDYVIFIARSLSRSTHAHLPDVFMHAHNIRACAKIEKVLGVTYLFFCAQGAAHSTGSWFAGKR